MWANNGTHKLICACEPTFLISQDFKEIDFLNFLKKISFSLSLSLSLKKKKPAKNQNFLLFIDCCLNDDFGKKNEFGKKKRDSERDVDVDDVEDTVQTLS